jgi:hypothetical protein
MPSHHELSHPILVLLIAQRFLRLLHDVHMIKQWGSSQNWSHMVSSQTVGFGVFVEV